MRILDSIALCCLTARYTLEDDVYASEADARGVKDMGTVRVNIKAVTRGQVQDFHPTSLKLPGDNSVSEKAKKAGSHAVK